MDLFGLASGLGASELFGPSFRLFEQVSPVNLTCLKLFEEVEADGCLAREVPVHEAEVFARLRRVMRQNS